MESVETVDVYKKAFEIGGYGIFQYDIHKQHIEINDIGKSMLGLEKTTTSITKDAIHNLLLTEDKPKLDYFAINTHEIKNKQQFQLKIHKRIDDQSTEIRTLLVKLQTTQNNGTDKLIGVFEDITDLKKTEKELIKARDKALESDKNKTAFLVNMSHEIRTPMNAIIGFTELLNLGSPDAEKRREWTQLIKSKGKVLLSMVDDLMEIAKLESGNVNISKSACNMNQLLKEIHTLFNHLKREKGKEHLEIRVNTPFESTTTYSDSGRIIQILNNLVNNSIKYTVKGYIEIGYHCAESNKIEVYVKDTGVGFSKEALANAFNKQKLSEEGTSKRTTGSGLGLIISKSLVNLLGGKIWIESEPSEGTTVYFTLPYKEVPPEQQIQTELIEDIKINDYNWKNKVVLIVEDEEVNHIFLESVLHDTQAQLLFARNGKQAVELVKSIHKIDLILMDIKMPHMDGFTATREIKSINNNIPIIAQTALTSKTDIQNSMDAGCDDYISKPIDIENLIFKINRIFSEIY